MDDPSRVQVSGPLAPLADDFATWLAGVGYTPGSAAQQLRRMARLSEWMMVAGVGVVGREFDCGGVVSGGSACTRAFACSCVSAGSISCWVSCETGAWSIQVGPVGSVSESAAALTITRFARYLEVERGLAARTIARYLPPARVFLDGLEHEGALGFERVTPAVVTEFVVDWSRRLSELDVAHGVGVAVAAAVPCRSTA